MAALKYAILALAVIGAASASRLELNGITSVCTLVCMTLINTRSRCSCTTQL